MHFLLLHWFTNNNCEYIFIIKRDLKLGLYFGIANLGLGLRINDSLLFRIIGFDILECIPIFCVWFRFYRKDENESKYGNDEKQNKKSFEIEEVYTVNRIKNQ